MVARITIPGGLLDTLNYNEKKVQQGVAACIGESGFLLPVKKMNFYQKLQVLERRNSLNERASTKTIHISLNFDVTESLDSAKLLEIAHDYMLRLGFGEQPYLVYRHQDAGHPHIHIVSSTIRADGTRINTHNIGRNQSEIARKAVEAKHQLIRAGDRGKEHYRLKPLEPEKLQYGKSETKRGISNIVLSVVKSYNYTSLAELNAALKQFNVMADRGKEGGFIHTKGGLQYKMLGKDGQPIGVPIKASAIAGKPTLGFLAKRYGLNRQTREAARIKTKSILDAALAKQPRDLKELAGLLQQLNCFTVLRQNQEGRIYGITFVDNRNKSVFNGSEIGKVYSVANLLKKLTADVPSSTCGQNSERTAVEPISEPQERGHSLTEILFAPIEDHSLTPFHLRKKPKKKRKKIL